MYMDEGKDTIILAGAEYGSGSSRDWAAKGPYLQVREFVESPYKWGSLLAKAALCVVVFCWLVSYFGSCNDYLAMLVIWLVCISQMYGGAHEALFHRG